MGKILAILFSAGAASLPSVLAFAIYQSVAHSLDYFPGSFFLAGIFASAHALLLGVPAILVLARMHLLRPVPISVTGALVGLLPIAVFTALSPPSYWQNPALMFSSFTLLGATGALVFYFTFKALSGEFTHQVQDP